jgi:tetratricopeptide (TPR) repeat protein
MALRRTSGNASELEASLGQVYYENGDLAQAEQYFRSALEGDAGNLRALKGLAFILHEKDDPSASLFYLKYLEVDDKDAVVLANVGLLVASGGQYEEALAYYGRAERINPNWAKLHELKGSALYSALRFREAADAYLTALELDPKNAEIYRPLGAALEATGDDDAALKHYRAAIDQDPEDPHIHLDMALLFERKGIHEEASQHSERAAQGFTQREDDQGAGQAYWALGWALFRLGRWKESTVASERALKHDRSLTPVRFNLALALLHAGEPDKARREYEKGVEQLSDLHDLKYHAIHDLKEALDKKPDLEGARPILSFLEKKYEQTSRSTASTS